MKVFLVDLAKCNGCHNCQIVCKDEHCGNDWSPISKPQPMTGQFWCKVNEKEMGKVPWVRVEYTPSLCGHCADAPCVSASNGACYRRDDGLVIIDPERSKGMKDLVSSCPHGSIFWNDELEIPQKCTGCAHLLDAGWEVPRCADACATGALRYVEEQEVADLLKDAEVDAELKRFGSHVYYLNRAKPRVVGTLVDDGADEAFIGAKVDLLDKDGSVLSSTETDEFGDFEFCNMPTGVYSVAVDIEGYDGLCLEFRVDGEDVVLGESYLKKC